MEYKYIQFANCMIENKICSFGMNKYKWQILLGVKNKRKTRVIK